MLANNKDLSEQELEDFNKNFYSSFVTKEQGEFAQKNLEEVDSKSTAQKLEELIEFDEKGSPDQMTEEQKLEFQKRQWELFERSWKSLGRKGRRRMIKQEGKYSSKLKQRLKNT